MYFWESKGRKPQPQPRPVHYLLNIFNIRCISNWLELKDLFQLEGGQAEIGCIPSCPSQSGPVWSPYSTPKYQSKQFVIRFLSSIPTRRHFPDEYRKHDRPRTISLYLSRHGRLKTSRTPALRALPWSVCKILSLEGLVSS